LTVVVTCCLPGVKQVDVALRESCDFDHPIRLTGADSRAELVDVALRYAWVDADIARCANERVAIYDLGDFKGTSVDWDWDSGGERQKNLEQDAQHTEEHLGGLNGALLEVIRYISKEILQGQPISNAGMLARADVPEIVNNGKASALNVQ
jgi:hypothetical protein